MAGPADFVGKRSAFFRSVAGRFVAQRPTHDAASMTQWVGPYLPVSADLDHALLLRVDFPALANNNAGWEMLVVAPDAGGTWRIWKVR